MTKLLDAEDWAVIDHVRERTVRILDFTKKSAGGTGVKITHDGRWFIATAAHVVPADHDIRLLVPRANDKFISDFSEWKLDEQYDVALLEITEHAAKELGGQFATSDQMVLDFCSRDQDVLVVVCGYPGQLIDITDEQFGETLLRSYGFRTMTFFTDSIRRRDWPTTGILRPTGDDDLFLKYSADSVFEQINFGEPAPTLKSAGVDKFDPAGMSGGGIWSDSRPQDGKLWHPTPKLLGIEYAVNRKHGWM